MNKKKALKTYTKVFFSVLGILLIILAGVVCGVVYGIVRQADDFDFNNLSMNFTSLIYYTDEESGEEHELYRLYDNENRIWADEERIPQHMKDAVVAIEDERFYSHKGFDVKRLIGAAFTTIAKREYGYGASTITQQLVKNLTGDDRVLLERKIQEIYRAIKIEKQLSKERILELYLNTIYLGQQCNGVQAAANVYFGKDVSDLSLAECASLAGITQFPSKYDPIVNPENNKKKQELVLKKMLELGMISKDEHDKAVAEKLVFTHKDADDSIVLSQSYFVDAVVDEVLEDLQEEKGYPKQVALKMLYSGGLKIYATVDMNVQKELERVYTDNSYFPTVPGDVQPESAVVIIDPATGNIVGLVGGRGEKSASRTLNRATQTLRQPGSTIKPIAVYAPALEYGHISPTTTILDGPITIDGWSPRNAGGTFSGTVNIKTAVARSLNTVAVKVLDKISLDTSFDFLRNNLGISSLVENETRDGKVYTDKGYAPLSLGGLTDGISVLEMCSAYVPFVSKGLYTKPSTYTKVLDYNGNVILERKSDDVKVAMSEYTAYQMTQLLEGVMQFGTGTAARLNNMSCAGKTGTTTNDHDRWFIGYTPYYVGAVWFGYDQPKSLGSVGYNPAIPIWKEIMTSIHANKENKPFTIPTGFNSTTAVCSVSGKLASPLCYKDIRGSKVQYEHFRNGHAPMDYCSLHKSYMLCTESRKIATSDCPNKEEVSALGLSEIETDGYLSSTVCNLHHNSGAAPDTLSPMTNLPLELENAEEANNRPVRERPAA
ncbi:MAG: PBP1A family penicillin-binding protein [Clostridia bacterium]|nr:PBP1A family penicillin-binding protein [Clostridia bacterium]